MIELDFGILVYPPETDGELWRAVFTENGQRKYRQGATEAKLAAKLEKVKERLSAGATNMERPGADLIAYYLDTDRLPVNERWSRKHTHTQRRLCERFAAPVIGTVTCQDIGTWHTQQIVNAAPTAGEGARVAGMLSALVAAASGADTWPTRGWPWCTGKQETGRCPPRRSPWPGSRCCGSTRPRAPPPPTWTC